MQDERVKKGFMDGILKWANERKLEGDKYAVPSKVYPSVRVSEGKSETI